MSEEQSYTLSYSKSALDTLKRLDKSIARRITAKAEWLAANAMTVRHKALTGRWHGLYKWRVGEYRIVYSLDHERRVILIAVIGNRSDIYDE
jgi:mRNA interferase RelE/StbE